jgi:hypothetical protein
MDEKEIKVTGTRVFDSGAHRDPNTTKGRYDLLSPLFMRRLAVHTQKGGVARGDRNWEKGMPMDAVLDSAIRHCYNYLEGDRSEDHLAAAAWNIMNLIHTEEQIERGNLPKKLSEGLPDYTKKPDMTVEEVFKKLTANGQYPFKIVPVEPEDVYKEPLHPDWAPVDLGPYDVKTGKPYEQYDPLYNDHDHTADKAHAVSPYMRNLVMSDYTTDAYNAAGNIVGHCKEHGQYDTMAHAFCPGCSKEGGKPDMKCETCIDSNPVGGPVPLSQTCEQCNRLSNWRPKS